MRKGKIRRMRNFDKKERLQLVSLPEVKAALELEELRIKRRLKVFQGRQLTSHFYNALLVQFLSLPSVERDRFLDDGIAKLMELLRREGDQPTDLPSLRGLNNFFALPAPAAPPPPEETQPPPKKGRKASDR